MTPEEAEAKIAEQKKEISWEPQNLEEQARNYRVLTDIMLNHDNCPHIVVWGLKDNDSWRTDSNPLLYTASLGRKPAWFAVRSALRHRVLIKEGIDQPVSPSQVETDVVYDIFGRRVQGQPTQPGIYIRDGKKFIVGRR